MDAAALKTARTLSVRGIQNICIGIQYLGGCEISCDSTYQFLINAMVSDEDEAHCGEGRV